MRLPEAEHPPPENVGRQRHAGIIGGVRGGSGSLPLATGGVGGVATAAFVGGSTAGSPQPSPISTGKLFQNQEGRVGPDGVQPRGTEAAVPGAGPGSGGPPFRLCPTADRPGVEVAVAGDMLGGRRSGAGWSWSGFWGGCPRPRITSSNAPPTRRGRSRSRHQEEGSPLV